MDSIYTDFIEPVSALLQSEPVVPAIRRSNLLVVIEDTPSLSLQLGAICDFLGIGIHAVSSAQDLGLLLDERRPLAVIAEFEGEYQDGGHVLKTVAVHDSDLPVMVLLNRNAAFQGATEALVDILQLTAVQTPLGEPEMGEFVDFLARAGQHARCRRMTRA